MKKPDFEIPRAWYYLQNLVQGKIRGFGLGAAVIAGAYIFLYLVATRFGWVEQFPNGFYLLALTFVGLALSSTAFSSIHREGEGVVWFMLPASRLEKFVVTCLVNTLGVLIGLAITLFAADLVSRGLVVLLGMNIGSPLLNPFWGNNLNSMIGTACLQTLFLFASVRFAKHPALKMVLCLFSFLFIFAVVSGTFWWMLLGSLQITSPVNINIDINGWSFNSGLGAGLIGLVFSAFFLFATWLRLGESEVKDGIR